MENFEFFVSRVRCDGCGRFGGTPDGYYRDKLTGIVGYVRGRGWQCRHDFCDECARALAPWYICPKCGDCYLLYVGGQSLTWHIQQVLNDAPDQYGPAYQTRPAAAGNGRTE